MREARPTFFSSGDFKLNHLKDVRIYSFNHVYALVSRTVLIDRTLTFSPNQDWSLFHTTPRVNPRMNLSTAECRGAARGGVLGPQTAHGSFETLYQRRFLQPDINVSAFLEIYKIFELPHRSKLENLAK